MRLHTLFTFILLVLVGCAFAQSPTWTIQQNMQPRRIYTDSTLKLPVLNTDRTFATNRDSIGQIWMRPDSVKLFGRFPGNIIKAVATEDSVRGLRFQLPSIAIMNQNSVSQTGNWRITGAGRVGTYMDFDAQASAPSYAEGRLYYDNPNETFSLNDDITGTSLQIGQESIVRARNNTGSTITNGSLVYISGALGQNPTIALARADAANTALVVGMATHDIANNTVGKITISGRVNDLNTSAVNDGDQLFLSATVAGGYTNIAPAFPNKLVSIGYCTSSHNTQGQILINPITDAHQESAIQNQSTGVQTAEFGISGRGSAMRFVSANPNSAVFQRYYTFSRDAVDTTQQIWSLGVVGSPGGAPFHSGGDLAFRSYTTTGVPLSSGAFPFRMTRGGNTSIAGTLNSGAITSTGNIVAGVALQAANGLFHDGQKAESRDTTVTGDYTMRSNDLYIYVNNAADCTITLFTPVSTAPGKGRVVYVKKISDNAATVTVVVANGATIDDAASVVITAYNNSLMFRDNGTNYKIH